LRISGDLHSCFRFYKSASGRIILFLFKKYLYYSLNLSLQGRKNQI
jgi:hypothetical protein